MLPKSKRLTDWQGIRFLAHILQRHLRHHHGKPLFFVFLQVLKLRSMFCRKRPSLLLLCLLLALGVKVGRSQSDDRPKEHTIDSAMAISPDYMPVSVANLSGAFFMPLTYKPIDTTFFYTSEYDPLESSTNILQTLGTYSQAHKSMVFDYTRDVGFSMIDRKSVV